jgi:hypothetical protein
LGEKLSTIGQKGIGHSFHSIHSPEVARNMPIAVQCSCGQRLNVPDNLAGKQGKCPKCQQLLKIPLANAPAAPASSPKASRAPAPMQAQAPDPGLASLLEEAGVGKKSGPTCPRCETPIARGAVLCTKCGLNFSTGEQMRGHEANSAGGFGNLYLDEAVENMKRDDKMSEVHHKVGMPWYVMAMLFVMVLVGGAGAVIITDSQLMGQQPPDTFIGWIQQYSLSMLLGVVVGISAIMLNLSAVVVVLIHAFSNSAAQGLMVMFLPFYIFVYQVMNWEELKGSFISLCLASVLGSVAGALIGSGMPAP